MDDALLGSAVAALADRDLPPLPSASGSTTARQAALALLAESVYGHSPIRAPAVDTVDPAPSTGPDHDGDSLVLGVHGEHGVARIHVRLALPAGATADRRVPLVVLIGPGVETADHLVPTGRLLAAGVGICVVDSRSVTPDDRPGLADAFGGPDPTWGHLAQWGWAARCAADHARTVDAVDPDRIWLAGHSRYGKAALWAAATDDRIAGVIANNSGCAGVAVERGKTGERYTDAYGRFPHWFAPQFRRSAVAPATELPFDQHWLTAAVHPRPVCIGSAADDAWADPLSELVGCLGAAASIGRQPPSQPTGEHAEDGPGETLRIGHIRYHRRPGPHALTAADWQHYLAAVTGRAR